MPSSLYPSVSKSLLQNAEEFALCSQKIELPSAVKETVHSATKDFVQFKKSVATKPWENSVLNSLDFHYSNNQLKIIEANTNASGYLLSNLLLNKKSEALEFEKKLFSSFKLKFGDFKQVAIADAEPQNEKMFIEFLMFKNFFERNKITTDIIKTSDINAATKFVYNRDTDFYLEQNPKILEWWSNKSLNLSTSPYSYENLAEKSFTQIFENSTSLKTLTLTDENREDIWKNKKNYFFKPSSSYGSRGVYAGKSLSRKRFETLENGYLAQELHLPGKVLIEEISWKYDIRAFFSEGDVQKIIARVYRGQLTNFSNPGGGFALIDWV